MGLEINNSPYLKQDSLYNSYMCQFPNLSLSKITPMQYGYYNLPNSTPSFRGSLSTPPDTVSFSASNQLQPKKEGMSTGAKWGLGTLAVVGLGTLAYVLSNGKIGSKQTKQLVEHINFQPAKSIEEAKKFAKDKLGVRYNEIEDLGAINFFNEWITGLHNKSKVIDKYSYPMFISNAENLGDGTLACLVDEVFKYGNKEGYVMGINMDLIKNFGSQMDKWIGNGSVIAKKDGKYFITNEAYNTEFTRDLVRRMNEYNPKTTTFKEKNRIILDTMSLQDGKIVNGKIQELRYTDYHYLNHELGHLKHHESASNYNKMKKIKEYDELGEAVSDVTREFVSDKQIQATARKVSDYATESPLEFVAETFSQLMDGKKLPDDVMALYKKYNGPTV